MSNDSIPDVKGIHVGREWFERFGYAPGEAYDLFMAWRTLADEPLVIEDYVHHLDDDNEPVWRISARVGNVASDDIAQRPANEDEERLLRAKLCLPVYLDMRRYDSER